jgi:hypothetical protein
MRRCVVLSLVSMTTHMCLGAEPSQKPPRRGDRTDAGAPRVGRLAVRHVHPFRPEHLRGRPVRAVRAPQHRLCAHRPRHGAMGADGQGRRHEVRRSDRQASLRARPVAQGPPDSAGHHRVSPGAYDLGFRTLSAALGTAAAWPSVEGGCSVSCPITLRRSPSRSLRRECVDCTRRVARFYGVTEHLTRHLAGQRAKW